MTNIHFRNANVVLDGFAALQKGFDVVVKDNYIDAVSSTPIDPAGATVIDAFGKTLMPGLIDAHAHVTGLTLSPRNISYSAAEVTLAASNYLRNSLLRSEEHTSELQSPYDLV